MGYAGLWLALYVVGAAVAYVPNPFAVLTVTSPGLLYAVPVAVLASQRRWRMALALLAGAVAATITGTVLGLYVAPRISSGLISAGENTFAAVALGCVASLNTLVVASVGVLVGIGASRGWTYTRSVWVAAGVLNAVALAHFAIAWEPFELLLNSMIQSARELIMELQRQSPEFDISNQLAGLTWFGENKNAFTVGFVFGVYLLLACIMVSAVAAILRRWFADPGPVGSFRDMRPPEWLVWAVIGALSFWLIDQRTEWAQARLVSWNVAIGLAAVYCLNGLSILLYGVQALAPGAVMVVLTVLLVMNVGPVYVLSLLGLFDTWANFRMRIDRLAERLRNIESGGGNA